jgi:hypothetical protein
VSAGLAREISRPQVALEHILNEFLQPVLSSASFQLIALDGAKLSIRTHLIPSLMNGIWGGFG